MAGVVRIAALVMRITGCYPFTVPMGRVGIITANPDILPVLPFVMAGNPDCRVIGLLPLLIILLRRRRALRTDLDDEGRIGRHQGYAGQADDNGYKGKY